jgi:hypothetical protein
MRGNGGLRYVKTPAGTVRIEAYALRSWRDLNKVLTKLTAAEARRCIDQESAGKRRRQVLLRLTARVCEINRLEAMQAVRFTTPPKPRTGRGSGKRRLTTVELENKLVALFDLKETPRLNAKISRLTRVLKRRRAEEIAAAVADVKAKGSTHLSKRALRRFQRETGDHFHDSLAVSQRCPICGEVKGMEEDFQL